MEKALRASHHDYSSPPPAKATRGSFLDLELAMVPTDKAHESLRASLRL